MQSNFQHCAALVREDDRDRYLATLFAPAKHRDGLFALYAYDAAIAHIRAAVSEPMPGEIRLQWWREAVEGQRDSEAAAHPVAAALLETMRKYKLAPDRISAVVDAHTADLYDEPLGTLDDLDNYAVLTRSAVYGIAADMLGGAGAVPMLARHAGIAHAVFDVLLAPAQWQLLVPDEVLGRHGVNRADIAAAQDGAALRAALAELRRHARRQFAAAAGEAVEVSVDVLPAFLPLATVGPQLRAMDRRGYEPFLYMPLSPLRRQWLIWRASRNPERIFATA